MAPGCAGPQDVVDHLRRHGITVPPSDLGLYHRLEVFRDDVSLGSLEWLKKAFHFWREEKDLDSMRTGVWFRDRRPKNKLPNGLVYKSKSLVVGRLVKKRGGQRRRFVALANQRQFLPRG